MDVIFTEIFAQWGVFGILLIALGWYAWDNRKNLKTKAEIDNKSLNILNEISANQKVLSSDMKSLSSKIDKLPDIHFEHLTEYDENKKAVHLKQLDDLIKLGPKLHRILEEYNHKIGSDHIFLGSFHNGNASLSGIPYYKFDIIAERFKPMRIQNDCEFAPLYKDADILRFDMLPTLVMQNDYVYFKDEENSKLKQYDDILWRRMMGRGIRQIALAVLREGDGTPSGFVGVVKYDFSTMDMDELKHCAAELEYNYRLGEENFDRK